MSPIFRDFHLTVEQLISTLALGAVFCLCLLFTFYAVPVSNKELITFGLGAIAGALTLGGGKRAEKITNSNGDNATVQPDAGAGQ